MRHGDGAPIKIAAAFSDTKERKRVMAMVENVTLDMMASNAGAFFDYLAGRPKVAEG
ncbi:hypothetical protein ABFA25_06690 [Mycobacterium lepromatosis]|nr:hypothetical protein [Mycobacterium lepromatosis]